MTAASGRGHPRRGAVTEGQAQRGLAAAGDGRGREGITERELKMGENLVLELDSDWAPEQCHGEYVEKLEQVVEAKKKAGDVKTLTGVVADEIVPAQGADIIDLTELLRRSLRGNASEATDDKADEGAAKRRRTAAANDDEEQPVKKAAAKKSSSKSTTSVKPVRRKRA